MKLKLKKNKLEDSLISCPQDTERFDVLALRDYYKETPHYRFYQVCNNPQRVYHAAEIIAERDWETIRKKIKVKSLI